MRRMQHKRRVSPTAVLLGLLVFTLVGGVVFLSMAEVPAPTHPIEKELDAKAFLEVRLH